MTSRDKLVEILIKAIKLLEKVGHILCEKERDYIQDSLDSKAVPTPKLLVKDHKNLNRNGVPY